MKYRVPADYGTQLKKRWVPPVVLTVIFAFALFHLSTNKTYGLIIMWVLGAVAVSMWWFMTRIAREFMNHEMEITKGQMILRYGERVETKKLNSIEKVTLRKGTDGILKTIEVRFSTSPRPLVMPYDDLESVEKQLRKAVPADRIFQQHGFFRAVTSA